MTNTIYSAILTNMNKYDQGYRLAKKRRLIPDSVLALALLGTALLVTTLIVSDYLDRRPEINQTYSIMYGKE